MTFPREASAISQIRLARAIGPRSWLALPLLVAMMSCDQGPPSFDSDDHLIRTLQGRSVSLDTSTQRQSEQGLFTVTATSALLPVPINRMHHWDILITDRDDQPVANAMVTVTGGMPEHDHGLPTAPRMTSNMGAGNYRIEGIRFNMGGWWQVRFGIESGDTGDEVVFNLDLNE